jgi:hypothetical protein
VEGFVDSDSEEEAVAQWRRIEHHEVRGCVCACLLACVPKCGFVCMRARMRVCPCMCLSVPVYGCVRMCVWLV